MRVAAPSRDVTRFALAGLTGPVYRTGVEVTVTSTEAKNSLNRLLSEVERAGQSVTITNHRRPVARLVPVTPVPRVFGQLPNLLVPKDFDDPLPDTRLIE